MEWNAKKITGKNNVKITLAIMTSGDTDGSTQELLVAHHNFVGLDDDQITIICQEKVPTLNKHINAGLALEEDNRWSVQTKPHGHGIVHHLLYHEGLVDTWEQQGKTHVVFLQDTNALVMCSRASSFLA